jgi:energy-coupling factor transport system substrate-specific component
MLTVGLPTLALLKRDWGLLSLALAGAILAFAYWCFEKSAASSREVSVVAVLGTVAALARVPFAALPGVQPTTFMVILAGFVFGPLAGFMAGSTAALVSNFFLGQGPWTPWQMLAWGLSGATAGWLRTLRPQAGPTDLAGLGLAWGYLYGWIMNFWFWAAFLNPPSFKAFLAACAASFAFDTAHALTNLGLFLLLGQRVIRILERFRKRLGSP